MLSKKIMSTFFALLSFGLYSQEVLSKGLPCASSVASVDTQIVCHNKDGFNFGCNLTRNEITLLRESIDANFNKLSAVRITYADKEEVHVIVQWNGNETGYVFNRSSWEYSIAPIDQLKS